MDLAADRVEKSALSPGHKANLRRALILSHEATNGIPEEERLMALCKAVAAMVINQAESDMYLPTAVGEIIRPIIKFEISECRKHSCGEEWDGKRERRGKAGGDGRDGRDVATIEGKGARFSGPVWAVVVVSAMLLVGWLSYIGAKGAKWI